MLSSLFATSVTLLTITAVVAPLPKTAHADDAAAAALVRHVKDARDAWTQSCAAPSALGECFRTQVVALPNRCQARVTVTRSKTRKPGLVRKTRRALDAAFALESQHPELRKREDVAEAIAIARFLSAEAEYEKRMRIAPITGLDFDPKRPARKKASEKRFLDLLNRISEQSTKATAMYRAVLDMPASPGVPFWQVAASARMALISEAFATWLYEAEIPRDVRVGAFASEAKSSFCDSLADKASPLEAMATSSFEHCRHRSQFASASDWSRLCAERDAPAGDLDDPAVVRRHVRTKIDQVRKCYEDELTRTPDLKGIAEATLAIGPTGKVAQASVSGLGNREAEACMAEILRAIHFPKPARATTQTIKYPLHFRAP